MNALQHWVRETGIMIRKALHLPDSGEPLRAPAAIDNAPSKEIAEKIIEFEMAAAHNREVVRHGEEMRELLARTLKTVEGGHVHGRT